MNLADFRKGLFLLGTHFKAFPAQYSNEAHKVLTVGSKLTGDTLEWFTYALKDNKDLCLNFEEFNTRLLEATTPKGTWIQALLKLLSLEQRGTPLEEKGLCLYLQGLMRHHPLTLLLPEIIEITRGLDMNRNPSPCHPGNNTPCPRPQIFPEELQRHVTNQLCFFCHLLGHLSCQFPHCSTQNDASVALGLTISDTPTVVTMGNNTTDTARQCVAPANIELVGVTTQLELLVMKNISRPIILGFP
ncbi:hypothetical protein DSO57_1029147 [Entomophthora muscae]|uniref:Uncharacterized protein n=1 Tax=Entomophthora muscae TaxID=34485 RepID=A0ACC2UBC1_9FUNG|nr:hypothetical protein DSO57_1029147 [Entomophthora muscae]